jgi:prepilin-type processing-associated H-X9-DG protein
MYSNDYDDKMANSYYNDPNAPAGNLGSETTQLYGEWVTSFSPYSGVASFQHGLIYPYTKNGAVQDCPAGMSIPDPTGLNPLTYAITSNILEGCDWYTGGSCDAGYPPPSYSKVSQPADTILLTDAAGAAWDSGYNNVIGIERDNIYLGVGLGTQRVHGIHNGRANAAWLDGHSKSMAVDVTATKWMEAQGWDGATTNTVMSSNMMGDISHGPWPADIQGAWGTPALDNAAWYYLLQKP